jgi:hypothetical protein
MNFFEQLGDEVLFGLYAEPLFLNSTHPTCSEILSRGKSVN